MTLTSSALITLQVLNLDDNITKLLLVAWPVSLPMALVLGLVFGPLIVCLDTCTSCRLLHIWGGD